MNRNLEQLSIEEIALLIKKEVVKIQDMTLKENSENIATQASSKTQLQENRLYNLAKKVGIYLKDKKLYKIVYFIKSNFRIYPNYYVYTLSDFNKYYDEEFINNAFYIIFKRVPNEYEKNYYLSNLRTGQLSKTEIVSFLYFKKEANFNNIKILGIKKRYIISLIFKIPIIGYITKIFILLATFPKLVQRLNSLENNLITTKVGSDTFETFKIDVKDQITTKVGSDTFETFKTDVKDQITTKIGTDTFEIFKTYVKDQVSSKADVKDIVLPDISKYFSQAAPDFLSNAYENLKTYTSDISFANGENLYYSLFESVFYPHSIVVDKQKIYLDYIPDFNSSDLPHLDIGCGRGEFLQNLKDINKVAIGIDINDLEVQNLSKKGYDVYNSDLNSFLKSTTYYFSSISALQVVEHLDFVQLKIFLALAYEKLVNQGVLIVETINPHNPVTVNSFYMDETHKKLIPPELLIFLMQWIGFKNITVLYSWPLPKEFRSRNDMSRNYHDYALIGYK